LIQESGYNMCEPLVLVNIPRKLNHGR
jgi:hypothetical protein